MGPGALEDTVCKTVFAVTRGGTVRLCGLDVKMSTTTLINRYDKGIKSWEISRGAREDTKRRGEKKEERGEPEMY